MPIKRCRVRENPCNDHLANPVLLYINDVVPHEDTDIIHSSRVLDSIGIDGALRKPIIVEKNRLIVIDGHHRLNALKSLGVKVVPAYIADYGLDVDDVGGWMYIGSSRLIDHRSVVKAVEELESMAKRGSDEMKVKVGGTVVVLNIDRIDVYLAFKELGSPNALLDMAKVPIDIDRCSSSDICVLMPKLEPKDIYRIATRGETLPPRTTYHKTYLKNLYVTYPLKLLQKLGV
ncbi:MAG: ParB N-terminal domain-containing protein [Ignisphaera sp.]